ncbi:MAG: hypothetical protein IJW24_03530 [Clostridia bacterium]|nr:hypothetical protein [Clostridia bacterium]
MKTSEITSNIKTLLSMDISNRVSSTKQKITIHLLNGQKAVISINKVV